MSLPFSPNLLKNKTINMIVVDEVWQQEAIKPLAHLLRRGGSVCYNMDLRTVSIAGVFSHIHINYNINRKLYNIPWSLLLLLIMNKM